MTDALLAHDNADARSMVEEEIGYLRRASRHAAERSRDRLQAWGGRFPWIAARYPEARGCDYRTDATEPQVADLLDSLGPCPCAPCAAVRG